MAKTAAAASPSHWSGRQKRSNDQNIERAVDFPTFDAKSELVTGQPASTGPSGLTSTTRQNIAFGIAGRDIQAKRCGGFLCDLMRTGRDSKFPRDCQTASALSSIARFGIPMADREPFATAKAASRGDAGG
jgi:hypothetical protein